MANIPVSALPAATVVNDADALLMVQGAVTKRVPASLFATDLEIASSINAAISGQVRRALWNGTAYTVGSFVVANNNRPANIFYDFIGGPDPSGLNLGVVNGDTWQDAS